MIVYVEFVVLFLNQGRGKAETFDMVLKTVLLKAIWNIHFIHPVWYAYFYPWSKGIFGEWLFFPLWLNSIGNNMHSSFSSCSFISLPSFMFCCRHDYCCLFSQKFEDVDMVHTLYTHKHLLLRDLKAILRVVALVWRHWLRQRKANGCIECLNIICMELCGCVWLSVSECISVCKSNPKACLSFEHLQFPTWPN